MSEVGALSVGVSVSEVEKKVSRLALQIGPYHERPYRIYWI